MNTYSLKLLQIFLLFLSFSITVDAQFDYSAFLSNTKDIRRTDNFGTDFYLTIPPAYFKENTNNITIKLFVFSYNEAKVKITVPAKSFTENTTVSANTEKVFDILPEIAFPFSVTSTLPLSNEEIYKKSALRISSDYPVAVYVLISGNLQSEGYLALPVSSAGNEYVLQSYIDPSSQISSPINYPAMAGIVNPFNGNRISVILSNNLKGKIFPSDTITRVLDEGDTWFVSLKGKNGDLSGIRVVSDKPISVITANQSSSVPVGVQPNNYLIEQEMPVNTWGNYFHVAKLPTRNENPIIKVLAKEPDTEIYLNGQYYQTLNSISNTDEFIEIRPIVTNPKGLEVISSNKKISASVYFPGYSDENANNDFFKPSRMNLVPFEQYANSILFNVSRYLLEIEKNEVSLYIITQLNSDGTIPDDLELGNFINNSLVWTKVNTFQNLDKKEFKYQFNGKRFAQIIYRIPKSGNYKIRALNNFAIYLFGSGEQGTFAFPAGMPQKNMLSLDNIKPSVNYLKLCDGSVAGTTVDMPLIAEQRSNLSQIIFHSNLSRNYDKSFENIIPGVTTSIQWNLVVRNKDEDANAVVTFKDYAGNDSTISVEYKAPKINIQPQIVNFGNTKIGIESLQKIKIVNNSDSTYRIRDILFKYEKLGFKLKNQFYPEILNPKAEIELEISFLPLKTGIFEDSVGLNNDCFNSFKSKLIARVGSPKILVTDVFFSDVSLPNQETKVATISNLGENDLIVTGWKLTDNSNFSVDFGREISLNYPLIIEPNKSFTFSITFSPKVEKVFNEQVIFTSDASDLDSICIIKAKAILPGIITSSYDWLKLRFDDSSEPKEYEVPNAIIVKNTGKSDITITKVSIEPGSVNTGNFIIDFNKIINKSLKPNEIVEIPAKFIPRNLGLNELIIKFETNLKTENISKLSSFVVIPKLMPNSDIIDFDTTLVNYPSQENNRLIEIINLSQIDWQYADLLTIYEIQASDPKILQIGEDNTSGSFAINTTNINFPIQLLPGEKLSIPASFSAKDTGLIRTNLIIKSDALSNAEIELKGYGADRVITISNLEMATCINESSKGICQVRNNSVQAIEIEKLYFNIDDPDFEILEDLSTGIIINPSETRNIDIQYTPSGLSSKTVKLLGQLKGDNIPSLSAVINGVTNQYTISSYMSPVTQTANINEDVKVKIYIEDHPQISQLYSNKYFVSLRYEGNFMKLLENSIVLGKTISGRFKIENFTVNQAKGEAKLELISLQNNYQLTMGELLSMEFHTYLPTENINSGQVRAYIVPSNNPCFLFQTSSGNLILNATCTGDLRRIKISSNDFYLKTFEGSILNNSKEIEFGIAFDGLTEISIFNSFGNLVSQPFNGNLTKGHYSFNLDITNLSNGLYFILIKSSDYSEVKKFFIEK